ncbi:MAG: MotA/TolQ/ExbB proton channel family protein [Verrucomicrobia bacterium]|nr:MotA/TolQ/ExbB proton channel family protein [Verrucomicrobiota bacterium]
MIHKIREVKALQKQAATAQNVLLKQKMQPLNCHFANENSFSRLYRTLHAEVLELLNKNKNFINNSVLTSADIHSLNTSLNILIAGEEHKWQRHLYWLPTAVSLAPFLGLLGTVWGILAALGGLQTELFAAGSPVVLGGISMALATTVLGLLVAIPPLVGYNYLRAQLRTLSHRLEEFSCATLGAIELTYRKVEE